MHLTNAYHGASGGVRTFYHALLDGAERLGRRVVLVVPGAADDVRDLSPWSRVHTVRAPSAPIVDRRYRVLFPHRFLLPWRNRIRDILRQERPDLVEINDKYTLCYLAGPLRKEWWPDVERPTIVGHSAERFDDNLATGGAQGTGARRFSQWYMRTVYVPLFDYHVANSPYTARELTDAAPAWRRPHVSWLPMGVDLSRFGPWRRDARVRRDLLARAGGTEHSVCLLYAGRLAREKSVPMLVGALAELCKSPWDVRLVIAGDGPLKPWLVDALSRQVPGRAVLLGHVGDPTWLATLLASADLFVHPNAREPFGIAPLEAMASGTPVVLPGAGGLLAYATSRNAWLAEPSATGLAHAITLAWQCPGERARRVHQALRDVEGFAWSHICGRWFEHYDSLHARGRREWHASRRRVEFAPSRG
jgi:alpha-1,6-mannosyltransferase